MKNLEVLINISLFAKWKWRCLHDTSTVWRQLLSFRYGDLSLKQTSSIGRLWGSNDTLWWRDLMLLGDT